MNTNTMRGRLLASTVLVGASALAVGAQANAQTTAAAPMQTAQNDATPPTSATAPSISALPEASTTASGAVKEVVVTGSRIAQKGLTSASPLAVINDQEIKLEGTTNIENLLNGLPQVFAAQNSTVSNGSNGTATVNLRDIGTNRTLVLVDGRRLMPGDPGSTAADLNNIPTQLVDRVEVTTGGASAIYGSDAVSGVVNFIMKHDFQGVRIDAQGGFAQHTNGANSSVDSAIASFNAATPGPKVTYPGSNLDGRNMDVTAIFGANTPDDKGNVTAYVEYRNTQPVTEATRSYSACSITSVVTSTPGVADAHTCTGSSNTNFGHFQVTSLTPVGGKAITGAAALGAAGVTTTALSDNPSGANAFVPYTSLLSYNTSPLNYIQRNDERYTAGYFAHYRVNDHFEFYSDFMFADDHTDAQIAQSGLFGGTAVPGSSTFQVNCNNPFLSASQAKALCGNQAGTASLVNLNAAYRFINNGAQPRINDLRHTDYKIDIGSKGELAPGWSYDAYLQYGTSIRAEEYKNDVSTTRTQNALLVNPNGTCMSSAAGCVPLNIFSSNGLTSAALNYLYTPAFQEGQTVEQVASASVTGDLGQYGIRSPFATDGVGVAFGTEYRRENLSLNTDQEFTIGDLAGQGGPSISNAGTFDVYELFGEARVPLVQDKPLVKSLAFDGAYRFSQYSAAGRTDTYEAQFTYQPVRDLTFRGGYSRAVRAPNVNELFASQAVGLFSGSDPCAGPTPTATPAQCAKTGVAAGQYGNIIQCASGQCTQLNGGNTNLQPEKGDTFSAGAVFTPTFFKGFTLTVDWFDIKVSNIISTGVGGANVTLTQCIATGSPVFCSLIHRDPASGVIFGSQGYVVATKINTGFLRTEGIDVASTYRFRPTDYFNVRDVGAFDLAMQGTYTTEFIHQPVSGGGTYNCAGLYGSDVCGEPIPHWRHRVRLTWSPPYPFTISLAWRYVGGSSFDGNSTNTFLHKATSDAIDANIPAYNYMDFSATYRIKDGLTARMGVTNLFDKDPPVVDSVTFPAASGGVANGNTFPGIYDALGRTFFFGITADF